MIDEKLAHKFAQDLMQDISYKINDMLAELSPEAHVFAVATMRVICASLEAQFDETDRQLLGHLVEHTEVCCLPTALDPRKKDPDT